MKIIKLFENFNSKNPIDIGTDIKSILYELEDLGMKVRFRAHISKPTVSGSGFNIGELVTLDDLDSHLSNGYVVDFFAIKILTSDGNNMEWDKVKENLGWFLEILRDHLDYIEPNKIRLEGRGKWISVKI